MSSFLFKGPWVAGVGTADVGVRAGVIDFVGLAGPDHGYERVVQAETCALMPGLINCHGHGAMTLFRGIADDLPLQPWLSEKIWPLEARLTAESVYWGSMLAMAEMIRGGTTTFADMYFFEEEVARGVLETGLRGVLARGIVEGPGLEQALKESRRLVTDWQGAGAGRLSIQLGPHALYTCSPKTLAAVMDLAAELDLAIQIHLSETRAEVEECLNRYGKSPVAVLNEAGLFEFPVLAAHCVHLNEQDLDILAEKQVRVSHNPASNLKLGSGVAPVPALLKRGVTVGLGTDGAASNNNLDMFLEMRLAALIHKGVNEDAALLPAAQVLAMGTALGSKALFLENCGCIQTGKAADLVLVDLSGAHLAPGPSPEAALVYSAHAADVVFVMAAGQVLLEGGHLTTIDEERVLFEARRCFKEITEAQL